MRSLLARFRRSRSLLFETLEDRCVMSASFGSLDQIIEPKAHAISPAKKNSQPYTVMTPADIRQAYGFDGLMFGSVVADGTGQTIAIVDAYNSPSIVNDLHVFDQQFGLPDPPSFTIVNQTGGTKLPKNKKSWAAEIAVDVEWAHAIAPGADILLVEATNATLGALELAVDYARNAAGVVVVSNSWGGSEFKTESFEDWHYTTPAGHEGVTFAFAAGDDGGVAEYPSSSPNVMSVGGTSLYVDQYGNYGAESVWSYSGGGASKYEGLPSYQADLNLATRGTPDVTYDSNPYTGFATYDSYGSKGWVLFGGTSAATPQWAALIAIANQGREIAGKGSLANAQAALYSLPSTDFHDITFGNNRTQAVAGYDLASGLGSPKADLVIQDLVAYNGTTDFTVAPLPITAKHGKSKSKSGKLARSVETGTDLAFSLAASNFAAPVENPARVSVMFRRTTIAATASQRFAMSPRAAVFSDNDWQFEPAIAGSNADSPSTPTSIDAAFSTLDASLLSPLALPLT